MSRRPTRPDAHGSIFRTARAKWTVFRCPITLPAHARDALVTGAWDTTGLLLERYEEVNAVAEKLPYVGGF